MMKLMTCERNSQSSNPKVSAVSRADISELLGSEE